MAEKGQKKEVAKENDRTFEEAYGRLNEGQKRAVDTIEGPVMVIAGPGTGKTQILALRIANILKKTDASPSSILALTFTESGVASMRARLVSLIGEAGYRARVHTFHGFANEVIRLYPDRFETIIGRTPLVELDAIEVIKTILDELRPAHLYPHAKPDFYVRDIISKISEAKREHVTPAGLKERIAAERANVESAPDLYHEKGAYTGKMKAAYADTLRSLARADEFVLVYEHYEAALAEKGYYDYEDTIIAVIETLAKDEELKLILQEEYQYILADEHQDANGSQNELLVLLADFHESPNLFIVGDEKQAIYRFQGASLENFFSFQRRFPDAVLVPLSENYRSTQRILDAAHALIGKTRNEEGEENERVKLLARALHEDREIVYLCAPDEETEHAHIARKIKVCLDAGVPPSEIAILVRRNSEIAPITQQLARIGVPFVGYGDDPVLAHPVVQGFMSLIRAIAYFGDDTYLAPTLALPYSGISNLDLYRIAAIPRHEPGAFYTLMSNEKALAEIGVQDVEAVKNWYQFLDKSVRAAREMSLITALEHLYIRSGCLRYIMGREDALATLDVTRAFFRYIRSLAAAHSALTLKGLLQTLEEAQTYRLSIGGTTYRPQHSVTLMSVHRAKGMEFDHVFIPHLHDRLWGARRAADRLPLPIPSFSNGTTEDDERRLLYVAVTRARKTFTLSYAALSDEGAAQMPSRYLAELRGSHVIEEIVGSVAPDEPPASASWRTQVAGSSDLSDEEKVFLRSCLAERGLSVTGLNEYLVSPWKYFFRHLLRVPDLQAPHLLYGTSVDEALKWYTARRKEGERSGQEEVVGMFVSSLGRQHMSKKDFETYRERGVAALSGYIERYADAWVADSESAVRVRVPFETGIKDMPMIPLRGELDKVERLGGEWVCGRGEGEDGTGARISTSGNFGSGTTPVRIVDYKTGKPKTRGEIEGTTKSSDGSLKRQLAFYTLLLNADTVRGWNTREAMLDFVEPDAKGNYRRETYMISNADLSALEAIIRHALAGIYEFAFWDTPCDEKTWGKDGCLLVEAIKSRRSLFG